MICIDCGSTDLATENRCDACALAHIEVLKVELARVTKLADEAEAFAVKEEARAERLRRQVETARAENQELEKRIVETERETMKIEAQILAIKAIPKKSS